MFYLYTVERDHRDYTYIYTTDINEAAALCFELNLLPDFHAMWNGVEKWIWDAPDNHMKVARNAKAYLDYHKHDRMWLKRKQTLMKMKEKYKADR